jgi:hypothetical protein
MSTEQFSRDQHIAIVKMNSEFAEKSGDFDKALFVLQNTTVALQNTSGPIKHILQVDCFTEKVNDLRFELDYALGGIRPIPLINPHNGEVTNKIISFAKTHNGSNFYITANGTNTGPTMIYLTKLFERFKNEWDKKGHGTCKIMFFLTHRAEAAH